MALPDLFFISVKRSTPDPTVTLWRRKNKPEKGTDWEDQHGFFTPIAVFPVAIGAQGYETPLGPHYVTGKARNPDWRMPNSDWVPVEKRGKVIPGGHPDNPLKAAFISLGGNIEDGVGFHGTANLESIGTMASHGCIRMRPEDVTFLYSRVPVGTLVWIGTEAVTAVPVDSAESA